MFYKAQTHLPVFIELGKPLGIIGSVAAVVFSGVGCLCPNSVIDITEYSLLTLVEIAGLKRKLTNNLSPPNPGLGPKWEVGECIGVYWRPNFETILYPYLPPHITRPKECKKLFVSPLPEKCYFAVGHGGTDSLQDSLHLSQGSFKGNRFSFAVCPLLYF